MSTRIDLQIVRRPDIDLIDYGLFDTRILCDIIFESSNHSEPVVPMPAVIDTGAPLSVIPKSIWSHCFTKIIQEKSFLTGIVPGEKHILETKIGIISGALVDRNGHSHQISFCAHLVSTKKVPVILGIQNILDESLVHIDIKGEKGWLEFK